MNQKGGLQPPFTFLGETKSRTESARGGIVATMTAGAQKSDAIPVLGLPYNPMVVTAASAAE